MGFYCIYRWLTLPVPPRFANGSALFFMTWGKHRQNTPWQYETIGTNGAARIKKSKHCGIKKDKNLMRYLYEIRCLCAAEIDTLHSSWTTSSWECASFASYGRRKNIVVQRVFARGCFTVDEENQISRILPGHWTVQNMVPITWMLYAITDDFPLK